VVSRSLVHFIKLPFPWCEVSPLYFMSNSRAAARKVPPRLRAPCERRQQHGDGVREVGVRVRVLRRVVNHEREDETLARGAEEVARKRCGRAERAGLCADVSLRGRALHACAQRAVNARNWQSLAE